jgi:hypothetical protein
MKSRFIYLGFFSIMLSCLMAGQSFCAVEWHSPSDMAVDGNVNLFDFARLASNWLKNDCNLCGGADITFDDSVTINDLWLFSQQWLDINYTNRLCKQDVLVASRAEMTTDVIAGKSDRSLCSENDTYIYATDYNGNVYRCLKTAGSQWVLAASGVAHVVWCLWDGYLFGVKSNTSFRYSEDNGTTWYDCNLPPVPSTGALYYNGWSLAFRRPGQGNSEVNSFGTVVLVEYGTGATVGRKIFKSVDHGKNWTQQYQINPATEIVSKSSYSHIHTIGYHAGTGRFLAIVGDGPNRRMFYSDDDGGSWITAQIESGVQPVQLLDVGLPTEFVCGADRALAVYTLDVSNMEIATKHQKLTNWQEATASQTYCFMLRYWNGMYYAFQYDSTGSNRLNKISVSPDLEHWAVYYQFQNNEKGVRYVGGLSEDGVHLTVVNASDKLLSMVLKPASVEIKTSYRIIPPINNIFSSAEMALGNDPNSLNYWAKSYPDSAVITSEPNGGLFDERHIKLSKGITTGVISVNNTFTAAYVPRDGKTYAGRIWLRGHSANQVARVQIGSQIKGYNTGEFRQLVNADDWMEIVTDPLTVPATGGLEPLAFRIYAGYVGGPLNTNGEIHIGGICISPNRVGLQLGGNCDDPEILRKDVNALDSWSSCFRAISDIRYSSMTQYGGWDVNTSYVAAVWVTYGGKTYESLEVNNIGHNPQIVSDSWRLVPNFKWHVKTWMQNTKNYLVLYLDSLDLKFKLDAVVNGNIVETLQTSSPFKFEWMSQLDFAVCLNGAEGQESLKLSVSNAGHLEHIVSTSSELKSAIAGGYMRNRPVSQAIGNQYWLSTKTAGGNSREDMMTVPMSVVTGNDNEFGSFLSNSEIENVFNGL